MSTHSYKKLKSLTEEDFPPSRQLTAADIEALNEKVGAIGRQLYKLEMLLQKRGPQSAGMPMSVPELLQAIQQKIGPQITAIHDQLCNVELSPEHGYSRE